MNRRKFIKLAGMTAAAATVAPEVAVKAVTPTTRVTAAEYVNIMDIIHGNTLAALQKEEDEHFMEILKQVQRIKESEADS